MTQQRILSDADVKAIAEALAQAMQQKDCLTQAEVYEVRGMMAWWRAVKVKTGEIALKFIFTLILVGGAIIAWLTQPWR